jgi:hypothetical protein
VAQLAFVAAVRESGQVGALEWRPFSAISANQKIAVYAFNDIFRNEVYNYFEFEEDRRIVLEPGNSPGA